MNTQTLLKSNTNLRSWLLLFVFIQSQEWYIGDLNHLETDTRNITDGVALTTETGNKNFVVFVDKVQTTVIRDESGDLLSIFQELNANTLSNRRIRLFSLNTDLRYECNLKENANLVNNDSLGVGSPSKGIGLPACSKMGLFVLFIGPFLGTAVCS